MRKLLLSYDKNLAPGDYVVTTALLRDIKRDYGDDVLVNFKCPMQALMYGNPHIAKLREGDPGVERHIIGYKPGMESSSAGNKHHFAWWLYKDFQAKTGLPVRMHLPRPDLHLTKHEKELSPISGRYWLVFGGGKSDITLKHWDYARYQQLVDALRPHGVRLAQSGATKEGHSHPLMKDVLNLVGWGYLRELLWQIYHCEGVICPTTAAMHIAAAFEKPCVVIAGGREEPWWEAYDNKWGQFGPAATPVVMEHKFLHTVGLLDCCERRGCWKELIEPRRGKEDRVCTQPAERPQGEQALPQCLEMVTVDQVAEAVMSYYDNKQLPPIVDPASVPEPQILDPTVPWQPQANVLHNSPKSRTQRLGIQFAKPELGGKITICVTLRGDNFQVQKRCIDSILQTTPRVRMELRVAASQIGRPCHDYLTEKAVDVLLEYDEIKYEMQLLRDAMWHVPGNDIRTNYMAYFDQNAFVTHPNWLNILADTIVKQPPEVAMYGIKDSVKLGETNGDPKSWMKSRVWFNLRQFRTQRGMDAPNGDYVHFCENWFWVLRMDAARQCEIPDPDLALRGADITIGEQLHQGSFKLKQFNLGGSLVSRPPENNQIKTFCPPNFPWQSELDAARMS